MDPHSQAREWESFAVVQSLEALTSVYRPEATRAWVREDDWRVVAARWDSVKEAQDLRLLVVASHPGQRLA